MISQPAATGERAVTHFDSSGRIDTKLLQALLPLADFDFYLCGPNGFMQTLYDILCDPDVRDTRIYAQSFSPSALRHKADIAMATARPALAEAQAEVVKFAKLGFDQPWTPEEGALLEFAERHGLTPVYGCRNGDCGSCVVKLKSGSVAYRTEPNASIAGDEILICCSVPASQSRTIAIDL